LNDSSTAIPFTRVLVLLAFWSSMIIELVFTRFHLSFICSLVKVWEDPVQSSQVLEQLKPIPGENNSLSMLKHRIVFVFKVF
jgi:hypothetical protein